MPFPRYYKLPLEKRERLMEAAAREFAAYGFDDASVNRILDTVQMSKGAAYYHFADKVDLFFTVIQYCIERLQVFDLELDPATLTAETFWPSFAALHRQPLLRSFEQPWLFAAVRAAEHLPPAALQREPLASFARQVRTWIMGIVQRGQELGVIRADMPEHLIFAWLQALDDASDHWLLAHWSTLDREAIAHISDQTVDGMRRALAVSPEDYPLFSRSLERHDRNSKAAGRLTGSHARRPFAQGDEDDSFSSTGSS
jgi:AcrR family transcriptional regulator